VCKDCVVLITGAASGIGYSASQLFIQKQATVIGADVGKDAPFVSPILFHYWIG